MAFVSAGFAWKWNIEWWHLFLSLLDFVSSRWVFLKLCVFFFPVDIFCWRIRNCEKIRIQAWRWNQCEWRASRLWTRKCNWKCISRISCGWWIFSNCCEWRSWRENCSSRTDHCHRRCFVSCMPAIIPPFSQYFSHKDFILSWRNRWNRQMNVFLNQIGDAYLCFTVFYSLCWNRSFFFSESNFYIICQKVFLVSSSSWQCQDWLILRTWRKRFVLPRYWLWLYR